MPAPRWLARLNRRVINRMLGPVVMFLPGFGVIIHTGRSSGRTYRTPVAAFGQTEGFVIALTYGPDTDWVRNVAASGECALETRACTIRLGHPRIFRDERRSAVPPWVRIPLRVIRVMDFIELKRVDSTPC
jgi:deazaflavin-dependent oxidoreductase (nitroreductase family)